MASVFFHLSSRLARFRRKRFEANIGRWVGQLPRTGPKVPFTLLNFSSASDFPEQVLSWFSFLKNVGVPREIVLVSDESHTDSQLELIQSLKGLVTVIPYSQFTAGNLPPAVHAYAQKHPFGKKLAVLLSLGSYAPVLYADSDIFYFPGATLMREKFSDNLHEIFYLLDCAFSLDDRLLQRKEDAELPVNGGFIYFGRSITWEKVLNQFINLQGSPLAFTEQTLVHLAVRQNGGHFLPPDKYVLQADDQWKAADTYASRSLAIRHYISSIRYKMWNQFDYIR